MAFILATSLDPELRDPVRAVELARIGAKLSPQDGDVWNTLGVALYAAGKHEKSLEALQRSMDLRNGGDDGPSFFFAMAKHKLGQTDAREWFDKAVAWMEKKEPNDEELKRFRAEAEEVLGIKKD